MPSMVGPLLAHGSNFVWMSFLPLVMTCVGTSRNWTLAHWTHVACLNQPWLLQLSSISTLCSEKTPIFIVFCIPQKIFRSAQKLQEIYWENYIF